MLITSQAKRIRKFFLVFIIKNTLEGKYLVITLTPYICDILIYCPYPLTNDSNFVLYHEKKK